MLQYHVLQSLTIGHEIMHHAVFAEQEMLHESCMCVCHAHTVQPTAESRVCLVTLNMACCFVGLLQPLVKELTNVQDPLTCLSALSLLKEQVDQASSTRLQALLAHFFLPHLKKLLSHADSLVKPLAMQASCMHIQWSFASGS